MNTIALAVWIVALALAAALGWQTHRANRAEHYNVLGWAAGALLASLVALGAFFFWLGRVL